MAEPLRLKAKSASPGIASGPAFLAERPGAAPAPQTAGGYGALEMAIDISIGELERLAEGADPESRDIIDFQIEVLRDPSIAEATGARVEVDENVVFAWVATLDAYIGELETADEEQMRARAVDILDIKNRVLGALAGTPIADFPPAPSLSARTWSRAAFSPMTGRKAAASRYFLAAPPAMSPCWLGRRRCRWWSARAAFRPKTEILFASTAMPARSSYRLAEC